MIDDNLILWLPCNDPDGSVAYDFSINRNDATLSGGASFVKTAAGKALAMNGAGEALTSRVIPFSSNFTLIVKLQSRTNQIGWLLNFSGANNYKEQWLDVSPGESFTLSFVKTASTFTVYKDGLEVYSEAISGTPVGFSINDPDVEGTYSLIEEVKLYNVAKFHIDILKILMESKGDVEYYIDGVNFKEFGVYVTDSKGLAGRLARKEALTAEWDNYHGIVRDRARPRFKERNIELDCMIEASSRFTYIDWVNKFFAMFDGEGTRRLKVEHAGMSKPLVYEVLCLDESDPQKKFGRYNEGMMVGTFTLKLVEDEPVKKVLRHVGNANSTCTITVTSAKKLIIYWGDGSHTYNVSGTSTQVSHTYTAKGEYEIIVAGVIEDIEAFTTNGIVIWENLH